MKKDFSVYFKNNKEIVELLRMFNDGIYEYDWEENNEQHNKKNKKEQIEKAI